MNSNVARWDLAQQQYDASWGPRYSKPPPPPPPPPAAPPMPYAFPEAPMPYAFPEAPIPYTAPEPPVSRVADGFAQLQLSNGKLPRTRTSPVSTRSRVARHGSQTTPTPMPMPVRPSSSAGESIVAPRKVSAQRRAESYSHPTPLERDPRDSPRRSRRWPPSGYGSDDAVSEQLAKELICTGTCNFQGYVDQVPNAPPGYSRFYAVMTDEHKSRTDRATFQDWAYRDISLDLMGLSDTQFPWHALEQPCMTYAFGRSAGTTTLNCWISNSSSTPPPTKPTGDAKPRKMKLLQILDRLQRLEDGLEDDPEDSYRYLYGTLIEEPESSGPPHNSVAAQIDNLINVLSNPQWIDFSHPKNQVVAKWFDAPDQRKKQDFFHQLLLSVELYHRIHSKSHSDKYKRKFISQLDPVIAWDLAVAQRWLENMEITKTRTSSTQSTFSFDLKSKSRQRDALRLFAATLKWPNMDEIEYVLEESDMDEKPLEDRSADAMSWFSGIILPGRTLPWLIMNSLIDCDRDTGDALRYLTHMHPASGFQYRANTYWSSRSIVGKVLGAARGVKEIAGWVGPCIYTPDLKRTECVKVKQHESLDPPHTPDDIRSMAERSHPLGPPDDEYPLADYDLPMPDVEDVADLIRMEKLSFVPAKEQPASSRQIPGAPLLFDVAIQFACGGESWRMGLRYDVSFISAFPCQKGPHVLFYDFAYRAIRIDDGLVSIHDWGRQSGLRSPHTSPRSSPSKSSRSPSTSRSLALPTSSAHEQVTNVLVVEALGVSDNEVFARAWCAHHGHSAIVANVKETCMACAIREAYAACVSVVILTEGGKGRENDEGICYK